MDEATKQKLMIGLLSGAICGTLFQLFANGTVTGEFSWPKMFLAFVIAGVIGGAVFGVMKVIDK